MDADRERYVPAAGRRSLAGLYDAVLALTMRERVWRQAVTTRALACDRPGVVLDVGCGTATQLVAFARHTPPTRLVGVDGDADILTRARAKIAAAGASVELHQALADDLPLPDACVDCAVATLVLHHLSPQAKRRALAELHRVLRPGGRLIVADWGRPRDPLARGGFFLVQLLDGPTNTRDHLAGRLPHFIHAAGFTDVELTNHWRTAWGTLELFCARRPGHPHLAARCA